LPDRFGFVQVTCDDADSTTDQGTRTATIHLQEGEGVRCVFTSREETRGTIVIENRVSPHWQDFAIPFSYSGDLGEFQLTGSNEQTFKQQLPGTYQVTLDQLPDRFGFVQVTCEDADSTTDQGTRTATIHLQEGEGVRCVFTSREETRGTIVIENRVSPHWQDFAIPFSYSGDLGEFQLTGSNEQTFKQQLPGTYQVTLDQLPDRFGFVQVTCDDADSTTDQGTRPATIHLQEGEGVRCVFTSQDPDAADDRLGTIIIEKQGAPDDHPAFAQSATFTTDIPGCGPGGFGLFPGSEIHCGNSIAPGTSSVTEDEPTGAGNAFVSLSCDDADSTTDQGTRTATIHLQADETVRCVFVDTARRGTI